MNIEEIKERVNDNKTSLDCDLDDLSDCVEYLLSIIEQAEDALKFYADWQTHHKLSASDKITPLDADKGNIANQALKAIRGG